MTALASPLDCRLCGRHVGCGPPREGRGVSKIYTPFHSIYYIAFFRLDVFVAESRHHTSDSDPEVFA